MPGQPAARLTDKIICPMPNPVPPGPPTHTPPTGLPIVAVGCPTVLIDNKPAARIGDQCLCTAPAPVPNPILRGAFPVPIGTSPAGRMTDSGTHPGSLIAPPCCPTVLIGLAGTSGNPWAGNDECVKARTSRNPPPGSPSTNGQSYNNCGVESSRQIINRANNSNVSQETLLSQSINAGNAAGTPGVAPTFANGGTSAAQRVNILGANGVPAGTQAASMQNLETAVASGRGTISSVMAGTLWAGTPAGAGTPPGTGPHAILVTGVEYDENGNITNVIINDTGVGTCMQKIPAATFQNALAARGGVPHVVTNNPIW